MRRAHLGPGVAGLVFGAILVSLAFVLPQHPSKIAAPGVAQEARQPPQARAAAPDRVGQMG